MNKIAWASASAVMSLVLLAMPPAGADVSVSDLFQTPDNPTPDDNVTVTIELTNSSEVNKTFVGWCQSSPELCFTPRQMKYIGQDTFALDIGRFTDGLEIKYNVTVFLKNGTSFVTPTVHFKVQKAQPNGGNNNTTDHNDTNTTGNGTGASTGPNYFMYGVVIGIIVIMVAVVLVVLAARRKKPGGA